MILRFLAATAALVWCFALPAVAQAPSVVTTLSPTVNAGSSFTTKFTAVGDAVYFVASPQSDQAAIWKWTAASGAERIQPIELSSSAPVSRVSLLALGDKLLFAAQVDGRGVELWVTDGTSEGTTLVKDIHPSGSSAPVLMAVSGTRAFFTASDAEHGRELWSTDGTEAGTSLVTDLTGDSTSSDPTAFAVAGGRVYFHALNRFWVTDGSGAGTIALASNVGVTVPGVLGGEVFFLGSDDVNGREIWSTDGTLAGTAMLKDINPGAASSWGSIATTFARDGSLLLFFAEDGSTGRELWSTDGTVGGTQLVADITPGPAGSALSRLMQSGDGAYFLVDEGALWFSDGTAFGTRLLETHSRILTLAAGDPGLFFVTADLSLRFSDGSTPTEIFDLDTSSPAAPELTVAGSRAFFTHTDGSSGYEPWVSDGVDASMLADLSAMSPGFTGPGWMAAAGTRLFMGIGQTLATSDGTAAGTTVIGTRILSDYYSGVPVSAATLGETLLFTGTAGTAGSSGLWRSDGSSAGTSLVKPFYEIDAVFAGSSGFALVSGLDEYEWNAGQLWRSDGTGGGTTLLAETRGTRFTELVGKIYFLRDHPYGGLPRDLWVTEGTPATTRMVAGGTFSELAAAGGMLYLAAHDDDHGNELWRSDGTADGLVLIEDIRVGETSSAPSSFGTLDHILIFSADDGVHGRELWRSDGTAEGTYLLRDIRAGAASSQSSSPVAAGPYLYFLANDGLSGPELWRTDGTSAGTLRLSESDAQTTIRSLTNVDGRLMFSGFDGYRGEELWASDGSVGGTYPSFDLTPGVVSSTPRNLTLARDHLYFTTSDARLWALPRAATRLSVADARATETDSGTTVLQFTVTRSGDLSATAAVDFSTEDATAIAGSDYQSASGTIAFAAGQATRTIAVNILGDTILEPNETFAIQLANAAGGVLVDSRGYGIIDENDRRVALSLEYVPGGGDSYNARRRFRITNAGPSGASVRLKVSESPYEGTFNCDGRNPSVCEVGFIAAGSSATFDVHRSGGERVMTPPSITPGRTLTATVTSAEPDANLSDNTITRMIDAEGDVSLPPSLVAGSSAVAEASSRWLPATVSLSVEGMVVSPATANVTVLNPVADFMVSVPANAWGWARVFSGSAPVMRVPVVFPGETPKLDTVLAASDYIFDYYFETGETVTIPVRVSGTLPDGTRPSGTVALLAADGTVLQQLGLDGDGDAEFHLTDLPVGTHPIRTVYGGDAHFNGFEIPMPSIRISGVSTWTGLTIATRGCGSSRLEARVSAATQTPSGSIRFTLGGTILGVVALTPGSDSGTAVASMSVASIPPYASAQAVYVPDEPFEASSDWAYAQPVTCQPPAVIASAISTTAVSIVWSDVGADDYEILRKDAIGTDYGRVAVVSSTTFTDATAVAGRAYLYVVRARGGDAEVRSTSTPDLATTVMFSDDPILFRKTRVKAAHMNELYAAAAAVRSLAQRPPVDFLSVGRGQAVRAADFVALREDIETSLSGLAQPPPTWISGVGPGQTVRGVHLQQLRNVLK